MVPFAIGRPDLSRPDADLLVVLSGSSVLRSVVFLQGRLPGKFVEPTWRSCQ